MTDAPFLTLNEAAELLRVTARWLQRSDCPRIRIGGKVPDGVAPVVVRGASGVEAGVEVERVAL